MSTHIYLTWFKKKHLTHLQIASPHKKGPSRKSHPPITLQILRKSHTKGPSRTQLNHFPHTLRPASSLPATPRLSRPPNDVDPRGAEFGDPFKQLRENGLNTMLFLFQFGYLITKKNLGFLKMWALESHFEVRNHDRLNKRSFRGITKQTLDHLWFAEEARKNI